MQQHDYSEVMALLNQYAGQFNAMVQQVLSQRTQSHDGQPMFDQEKLFSLLKEDVEVDSASLMQHQLTFMQQQSQLWQQMGKVMMGEKVEPVISESQDDKRFAHTDWQDNPVFSFLKQSYLINTQMMQGVVEAMHFKDPKCAEQVRFYTRQYMNSMAPTNYLMCNPEVCEELLKTKGQSMVQGIKNFLRDLEHSPLEAFKITQTATDAFSVGDNLATTPGKIIYENPLMQLIHYTPATPKQYARPILFVPPFINKFYILDLNERKSMVKGLLDKGFAVFMISWVNPDASLAEHDFASYMHQGPIAALDVVCRVTGQNKVNMTGFCVGGTLLSVTAAYLRAKHDERIGSLTLLTTLLDFTIQGEIGNYVNDDSIAIMENNADIKGIYDGRILGLSFSLLRENNLFWSYFINNYLKGKDPAPFDILYWNSDATNITAACFKQYVRHTYWKNKLKEPGGLTIDGIAIDLANIDMPVYFLATLADHIVLWQGAYAGTRLVSGETRFVLAGSGHLAGVINPDNSGKYPHWINPSLEGDAHQWFEQAEQHEGSWWPDWRQWLTAQDKTKVQAIMPGEHVEFPAREEAPGSYVRKTL